MIMPPLKGLYAFEAVVRKGSYKAAAEELCVSRSAISHQITALEDLLKVRLLDRSAQGRGSGIALTEAGGALHESLGDAFGLVRRALAKVETLAAENVVGVALPPHFALKWLLPRLPRFRERHPNIDVMVSTSNHMVDFAREEFDVATASASGSPRA